MCKSCSWWTELLGQAVEFDLGDAIPKVQLLRDKQETSGIECFEQVVALV